MSSQSQGRYYVPGRERPRRSLASKLKYPLLSLLLIGAASYFGYGLHQTFGQRQHLASATTGDLVATTQYDPATAVQPVQNDNKTIEPAAKTADLSALITRNGLNQNRAQVWSVAVYDMKNSRWIAQVNPNQQLFSASLYKLYVALAVSKRVSFDDWSKKQVSGHSVKECMDLMIRVSDNNCGIGLGNMIGWKNVDNESRKAGFNSTIMNKPGGSVTTAADTAVLMSQLYKGDMFGKDASDFILNSLKNQAIRSGIPAGCKGCTTYNKTGNEGTDNHDTAIVVSGNNMYAVTIMSEGSSMGKIANVEKSIEAAFKTL
ncbi:MAG: beta-lactamase class [Candidatus Saccharibacteria bacterium]|nr:beta-lactamase class [Candidatus Saccharibacteria bacterium]